MSAMSDLDIKLSAYKLSDAQKNAVLDVLDQGWTSAKANTIKSLENRGILVKVSETHHNFTDEFVRESGIFGEQPDGLDREKVAQIQEIENKANTVEDLNLQADVFDHTYPNWEKELVGFGETLKWNNTKVWDGLTAQEIRDDLDTEHYVNRAARRAGRKMTRKAVKAFATAALNKVSL